LIEIARGEESRLKKIVSDLKLDGVMLQDVIRRKL